MLLAILRGCKRPHLVVFGNLFLILVLLQPLWAEADSSAGPAQNIGPTLTFRQVTAGQALHLVAYGDSRFADPAVTTGVNPRVRKWLAGRIAQEHPTAVLLTGDTPFTGAKAEDWQEFAAETQGWRAGQAIELPATGNHEIYGGSKEGIENYLQAFPEIAGHRYYSALLGNVEVISLDCTLPGGPSSAQARWFALQLEHVPAQVDFLLILYHMPWMADRQSQIFVGLPSKDALAFRAILEQRLHRLRARVVVFNGHIHNYERFEKSGVEYVISGGGGAEPYPVLYRGGGDLYHDPGFPVYHYLTVDISNRRLHAVMWKVRDPQASALEVEQKDEFTLSAPAPKNGSGRRQRPTVRGTSPKN